MVIMKSEEQLMEPADQFAPTDPGGLMMGQLKTGRKQYQYGKVMWCCGDDGELWR